MTPRYLFQNLLIPLLTLSISACSIFEPEFEPFTSPVSDPDQQQQPVPEIKEPAEVKVEALPARTADQNDSITIKWLVPAEVVDGYIVRYGFSALNLDYEERLKWSAIQTQTDTLKGKIFVHNLQGIPRNVTVYISLAGVKNDQTSKPTAIFSVSPTTH